MSKKEDILTALQQKGQLAKYDRRRFVVINDLCLDYGTSDYYGAYERNAKNPKAHRGAIRPPAPPAPAQTAA
jgi:hypothetical protein